MKEVKYKFFWGGYFSNWYVLDFEVDGIMYNCGEQYMMYHKAMTFNDIETANKIMEEVVPSEQKKFGRQVKNFDQNIWDRVKYNLIKKGLKEKFTQHEHLKKYLLKYKDYQIVEASPYDRIWGVGYDSEHAIDNIDNWGKSTVQLKLNKITQK